MTTTEIFIGLGLLLALAVGCQIAAVRLQLPAIVTLLPVGFVAGTMGHSQRVVRRLILWGLPITWVGAGLLSWLLLSLSSRAALMLGAILIVSGPTVVGPLLERARPGRRLTAILGWEGTTIDPIGAIVGALVFQALSARRLPGQQ
jgi:NhaP-type Na+/H+ or K+/H+ antiporter